METIKQGIVLWNNWYLWCLLRLVVEDCLYEGTFELNDTKELLTYSKQRFISRLDYNLTEDQLGTLLLIYVILGLSMRQQSHPETFSLL